MGSTLTLVRQAASYYAARGSVQVIVVDNNSTDRTAEIAREFGADVVFESENHIAKARNRGAQEAKGKFLVFLDADTSLDSRLLMRVDELLSSGQVIGGGAFIEYDRFWDIRLTAKVLNYLCLLFEKFWGAFLSCEKATFERIGGFDESLYGLEEVVFANALRLEGKRLSKKLVFISDCRVTTSARRLESRWHIITTRLPMLWRLKRKLADKTYCDPIWYKVER